MTKSQRFPIQIKYLIIGILFGMLFPAVAWTFELVSRGLMISLDNIKIILGFNPMIVMITTAPIFLGLFALVGGINHAMVIKEKEELTKEIDLRKSAQKEIEKLAFFDNLTGLPNRLLLSNRIEQAIDLAKRISKPLGILFMDIDSFKMVNDTMGHHQGDELLKMIAQKLEKIIRKSDTLARLGGDEFVILVQNLDTAISIQKVAEKVINACREPILINNQSIHVTFSIGISLFPIDGDTSEELLKNADVSMYKAKEQGKNKYVFCSTEIKDTINENMVLTNGLYKAVENGELEVYYQPQVCISTKSVVGLEALLRWNHPNLGRILPGKFIYLAEQTGLINPIGEWVIRDVCRQNKKWQEAGLPIVRIAVNLSVVQFQNPCIVNQIKEILEETGLPVQYLEFEITESIAMKDKISVARVLQEFKKIGLYISIDDFGSEYSSLSLLKELPFDRVKIPMPFIHGLSVNKKDEAITKTIIIMAKSMGMAVIAEGVETKQQETFLSQKLCDNMQGYYYYKPMPANEVEALLLGNLKYHNKVHDGTDHHQHKLN